MARCYYLEYISGGMFSDGEYRCKLCGKCFDWGSAQVKYTCNAEYGEEYQKCPVYKNR